MREGEAVRKSRHPQSSRNNDTPTQEREGKMFI